MKTQDAPPGQPNFDRIARLYRWAEWLSLGPLLGRTRRWFVPRLQDRQQALVLGDGDGRFLAHLMGRNRHLRADAVDISAAMLQLLRTRVRSAGAESRLETTQMSALHVTPRPNTDLVVTHFVLDCFTQTQVEALAQQMASHFQRGTVWLVSDFAIPQSTLLRLPAALYVRALYAAFWALTGLRVSQLPDVTSALSAAGFVRIERKEFLLGLLYAEMWRLEYNQLETARGETMPHPTSQTTELPSQHFPQDALPDPEPEVPSLPGPDPGVFHHEPGTPHRSESNA